MYGLEVEQETCCLQNNVTHLHVLIKASKPFVKEQRSKAWWMKNKGKRRIRINGTEQTAAQPNGYRSFKKHTTFAPISFFTCAIRKSEPTPPFLKAISSLTDFISYAAFGLPKPTQTLLTFVILNYVTIKIFCFSRFFFCYCIGKYLRKLRTGLWGQLFKKFL